jgi:signal transduction histidine kinase/ActR/RegA family two-component response regulator
MRLMWMVVGVGGALCLLSIRNLPLGQLDMLFAVLTVVTVAITSRMTVSMPGINGHITVSETFIFLVMLLYGGEAAVLLAAADGLCSSLLISRKPVTLLYNAAVQAIASFLTVSVLGLFYGPVTDLSHGAFSAQFLGAVCVMALVQYLSSSVLAAAAQALKTGQPVFHIWRKYCLWTSITFFAGASAAVITAKLIGLIGFYAIVATTPIIAIIYLTYRTYLQNINVMAAAAKAEAEAAAKAEQAEQARRHVEELSHYMAEQERIREQYAQIEKLSALGELASGVAHDFNNTLAGILGRAQLLLGTDDPKKIEAGLNLIIKTAKDGAKTVRRIQDFARQRRDHDFQPVAIDHLLLDVSEITRPRWKDSAEAADIHISLELQLRSNATVMGDESELREVLVNMIFNAVDAMPEGGTLTLSAEEENGAVVISVGDTGMGISDEVRPRIFDPFFTTKGKAGMGLGLAVSYGIVRRHEGSVEVASEVGRGTTFRIRLPIAQRQSSGAHVVATPERPMPRPVVPDSGRPRILVVDDEDHVRDLLRDILEAEGYEVALASGGREALLLFEQAKYDAVFTDVGMPGMSGWELARSLRVRDARLPVAAITGWGEAVGSQEQQAAGVDWVVAKPFTIEQIIEVAREASGRSRKSGGGGAFMSAA